MKDIEELVPFNLFNPNFMTTIINSYKEVTFKVRIYILSVQNLSA